MDTIKLEIDLKGMRIAVMNALSERNGEISGMVRAELDRVMTAENLRAIVESQVATAVRAAISDSIAAYFKYGRGAEEIRTVAHARLDVILGAVGE